MSEALSTTSRPPRRSQAERREATRQALLEAAVRCVCRAGYAHTTTTGVAREAGLSRGAVQHHFQDRNDLMACVVELGWMDLIERLRDMASFEGSLEARVAAVVDHMWESYASDACRAAVEITLATRGDPALQAMHVELFDASRRTLDEEWRRVFHDAPVSPERLRMSRRLARSLLTGTLQQLGLDPNRRDLAADIALLKETVLHTLTTEP
ncbi:MAG: TetR/AcrR family transcriptional regulator [Myxococcota bacterium]|nr:TetR/AcrR family transcriptional regulator [Myxococcota bacterium]